MSDGFTKLFGSLIHSTIWREKDHVRLVWITMLAMVNRHGVVEASLPGLSDAARVTIEECENAIGKLSSPDRYSRSKAHEGRRIQTIEGGWQLLNYESYRARMSAEDQRDKAAKRQRKFRENHPKPRTASERPTASAVERSFGEGAEPSPERGGDREPERNAERNAPVTPRNACNDIAEAEAEAEEDAEADQHPTGVGRNKTRRKKRTALPDEWRPNQSHLEKARSLGLNCKKEFEKFKAHAEATGRLMANWNATFTTWLLSAPGFARSGGRLGAAPEPRQPSRGYDPTKHAEKL